jgi:hypothetical protein
MGVRRIACKDGRRLEMDQYRVQWQALVLEMLNLRGLIHGPLYTW